MVFAIVQQAKKTTIPAMEKISNPKHQLASLSMTSAHSGEIVGVTLISSVTMISTAKNR